MSNVLDESISGFIDKTLSIQESNQSVSDSVKKMEEYGTDSLLVRDEGEIKGIVTYKDVLFDVVSKGKDPTKVKIKEIMHTPLLTIQKNAKIKDAISLMTKNNVRRLVVLDDKVPIGVISQKVLIGNIAKHAITLPELEMPTQIRCPYCSSLFDDKIVLSKHIDNIHIGRGLFDGNLSRMDDLGGIYPPSNFPKTI